MEISSSDYKSFWTNQSTKI